MARRRRCGEVICYCSKYKFPHRFGGGKRDGSNKVAECFENRIRCSGCSFYNKTTDIPYCEVLNGQESTNECPYLMEFIEYYEVKIYNKE